MKNTVILMGYLFGFFAIVPLTAEADALYIDTNSNVGVGTNAPQEKLHVSDGNLLIKQASEHAILKFAAGTHLWNITQNMTTGRLTFLSPGGAATTGSFKFDPDGSENLLRVGVIAGNTVDINGRLVVNGSQVAPDYVFESDYKLESIEEHSEFMWSKKHLPALPPAGKDGKSPVDMLSHQFGILEELEKAHIYIDKLNAALNDLAEEMNSKSEQIAELQRELNMIQAKR